MANIIINGFNRDSTRPVIYQILDCFDVHECLVTNTEPLLEYYCGTKIESFLWNDVKTGQFYEDVDWSTVRPLDRDSISAMSKCEVEVLRMLERVTSISPSYDIRRNLYLKHLRFWKHVIETKEIVLFISSNVPHEGFDYVIYSLCKNKSIPTLFMYSLPGGSQRNTLLHVSMDVKTQGEEINAVLGELSRKYDNGSLGQVKLADYLRSYLEEHQHGNRPVSYTGVEEKRQGTPPSSIGSKTRRAVSLLLSGQFGTLYRGMKQELMRTKRPTERTNAVEAILDYYRKNTTPPDYTEKYIYYPLHYQPEASTSPLAGVFVEQLLICHILSHALPDGVYLYIKEHPRISRTRDTAFYQELLDLRNTRLVPIESDTYRLIDHSVAVATATGSAGWEAFLRKKPVLMFGYRFYQYAPGVYRVNSVEDCQEAVRDVLSKPDRVTDREVMLFLKALESFVFEGYISAKKQRYATITPEQNINNIAEALTQATVRRSLLKMR